MAEMARTTGAEIEMAMIDAAVRLTLHSAKVASDVERNYRKFYKAVVESYQEAYPQMTSAAKST
jgi:hypothetical protein